MCNLEAYSKKSDEELHFIIEDAAEAAHAMHGVDEDAEFKYLDQMNDASTILYRRRREVMLTLGTR